jgi:hypothetical protein
MDAARPNRVITTTTVPRSPPAVRSLSPPGGLAVAGVFFAALFVVMAWGALHSVVFAADAPVGVAHAEVALVTPVHSATPGWHAAATAAAPVAKRWAPVAPAGEGRAAVTSALVTTSSPIAEGVLVHLPMDSSRLSAAAAPFRSVNQCNGTDNVGGQAVACAVTVTNNLNRATGATSSSVKTVECHGAAGAAPTCVTVTTVSPTLTASVIQCDGSGSGGGGTVTCSVVVVNNVTGVATPAGATINECVGSGTGGGTQPTTLCDPTASTTSATVTQCNGSGNGGGGSIRVQCTVAPSTVSSALAVTIDQCNGSGNGGGSLVICHVSETTLLNGAPVVAIPGSGGGTATFVVSTPRTATGGGITPGIGLGSGTNGLPTTPLAFTGSETVPMLLLGLLALALGTLLVLASGSALSRRREATA